MGKVPRKRRSSPSLRRAVHSFLELNLAEVLRDAGRTMREAPPQPREEQSSRRVDAYILLAAIASISCAPVSPTPAGRPKTSAASAAVPAEFAHPRQTVVSRPAVLFASPTGTVGAGVDLQYLRELHDKGFEVDYTDSLAELTWDRVKQYNVLVITITPDAWDVLARELPSSAAKIEAFVSLVHRFLDNGGGALLFPAETDWIKWSKQALADVTDAWGARVPIEVIVENDPNQIAAMTHANRSIRLAFTDRIFPSPVTTGVSGLWFPIERTHVGSMTGPLVVDSNWQVVARASRSSVTAPAALSKMATKPSHALVRATGEREPALVAIRELRGGRVALVNQWPQFTFGAGTRWIYNREVLERGLRGKPSNFGRLIENTLRWLAAPSLERAALGNYTAPADRLAPPNEREDVQRPFREPTWPYDPTGLDVVHQEPRLKTYRGLIGAETSYGAGSGSVEEYARAARAAKLDFIVFLDKFNQLTAQKLELLKADCARLSDAELLLLPGFTIESNLGDHLFFFSPTPTWPPDMVLAGPPGKRTLYLQEEDGRGGYTGYLTAFLNWVLDAYHGDKGQVGFYDFIGSRHGMRLHDARLYSMAGVQFYRHGKLIEDVRNEYLTTAQSTIAPAPVVIEQLKSPAALAQAVRANHPLTFARAESLDANSRGGIFRGALRWSHQYESLPVFASSGPEILSWPTCHRVATYGGEGFAPGRSLMASPLSVAAERGLKEITIYDGRRLFRRFKLHGERSFQKILVLDGSIQRNLVPIAEDRSGGIAIGAPLRSWADGALSPSFCSDHVNDCRPHMLLAHGPYSVPLNHVPEVPVDVAGVTWDGGPPARIPIVVNAQTAPRLDSNRGIVDAARADQVPLLDFSDEGAVSVASERRELYDPRLALVINPWNTFGPLGGGPIPTFDHINRFREWLAPSLGAPESEWAGSAVRSGITATLFTDTLRFKRDLVLKSIRLASFAREPNAYLVVGAPEVRAYDLASPTPAALHVERGSWFGFRSAPLSSSKPTRAIQPRERARRTTSSWPALGSRWMCR